MSLNHTVENVYLRQDAAQLTRRHFWRLLGMAAIVYAITFALQELLTYLGDLIMMPETQALVGATQRYANSTTITSADPMLDATFALFSSPKFLLYNLVFGIVTGVVGAGLTLGHQMQLIRIGQGIAAPVLGVFGRMKSCLKAFGLNLWLALKFTLWMLPGLLLFVGGAVVSALEMYEIGNWILVLGAGLLFVLGIPAIFRYAMATYILADEPTRGIRECVTLSKTWMKGRKWQYFKLAIPVVLKSLAVGFAVSMLCALVIGVTGLLEPMVYQLTVFITAASTIYFDLQLALLPALFYLKRREPVPAKPVSYWLRKDEPASVPAPEVTVESPVEPENDTKENEHEEPDC